MSLDSSIIVPWLALDVTGQWMLLALLVTYALVPHLPQRDNLFLVNFILAAFLATIPPVLLLYTGNQNAQPPPHGLCAAQALLMNGVAPLFGIAQLALVFDTWSELHSLCRHTRHFSRVPVVQYILLSAPYVAMSVWTIASSIAAKDGKSVHSFDWVYCTNDSPHTGIVHSATAVFMVVLAIAEIALEIWVGWMIYAFPSTVHDDPATWRTTIQVAMRIVIFSLSQFIVVGLSILNNAVVNNQRVKLTYELMNSMNALAAFVAFGTQKSTLRAWKFWGWGAPRPAAADELQPGAYPPLDWAHIPKRPPPAFDGAAFAREEKGLRGWWPARK